MELAVARLAVCGYHVAASRAPHPARQIGKCRSGHKGCRAVRFRTPDPIPGPQNLDRQTPNAKMSRKLAIKLGELLKNEGTRRATSFRAAFSGVRRLFTSERHFQLHLIAAACAVILAAFLRFNTMEWAILMVTIGLVLVAEGLNSALERAIDTTTPGFHPLAKAAKDIAAAAVLIAAIISVIIGLLLYGPKLWTLIASRH
jgi:diacylglycerol kinase